MRTSHPALLTRKLLTVFRYFIDIKQYVAIMDIKDCKYWRKNFGELVSIRQIRQSFLPPTFFTVTVLTLSTMAGKYLNRLGHMADLN